MVALSTVAVVDGGSDNGIFTTSYYNNDHHPCPHCPCSCPLLDKDQMAGWRVHRDASHAMVAIVDAIFVSTHGMTAPRTMAVATDEAATPIPTAGKRWDTMTPSAWSNKIKNKNKNKNKNKIYNSGRNVTASMPADSYSYAAAAAAFA
jgi:hypothetical protein